MYLAQDGARARMICGHPKSHEHLGAAHKMHARRRLQQAPTDLKCPAGLGTKQLSRQWCGKGLLRNHLKRDNTSAS